VLRTLGEMQQTRYVSAYGPALIYTGLGQPDRAFEWLDRARQQRAAPLAYLKVEPELDALRADRRFAALLAQIGLG
jgi:hypothetical protein